MFSVYANNELIYFPLEEDMIITSPKLSLEMGKAGSFQFGLPPTHRMYRSLQKLKTIITVEYDGVEIFRGRVLTMNRGFNNIRQVVCEGDLAYLVDTVQKGVKYKGGTHALFRKIIDNHNSRVKENSKKFIVGDITIDDRDVIISGSSEEIEKYETKKFEYEQIVLDSIVDDWMTTFDYIQDTIIDYCGGYLRTRRVGNDTYIDLLEDYGRTSIQKIEFGTNLIDLSEEVKAEDLFTVLIPLGEDNLTIGKSKDAHAVSGRDGTLYYYKDGDEIIDVFGVEQFGRIVKTNVFDGVNNVETLIDDGFDYLENHENMPVTFTIRAVDMHMIDGNVGAIYVGDRVYLNSVPHSLTQYLTCTKIEYDLNNPANNTYTFGNPKQTLTERYKKDKDKSKKSGKSSAARAGGASGAAAAVEADTNLQNFEKDEGKRIDAWLNVNPDQGHIDLGAFYKDWTDDRSYLNNTVGIDLDAKTATISLKATYEKTNKMEHALNNVGIILDGSQSKINIYADHKKTTDTEDLLNSAGITVDGVNSGITLTATHKKTDELGDLMNDAGITISAVDAGMNLYTNYQYTNQIGTVLTNNLGIKMDGSQGKIKIFDDHKTIDKVGNVIKNNLGIDLDAPQGTINIFSRWSDVEDAIKSSADFRLMADGTKATAGMFAKFGERIGDLELVVDDTGSTLYANVQKMIVKGDQEVEGKISAKALDVLKANIGRLSTDISTTGKLSAKSATITDALTAKSITVRTGSLNVDDGKIYIARKEVATKAWVQEQLKNYASSTHKHTAYYPHTHGINTATAKTNSQSINKSTTSGPI